MGGMIFAPEVLADSLVETAGYKAGLALSLVELCEHLPEDRELIQASEQGFVRIRSEEYDEIFYRLLHRIGHTAEQYDGDSTGIGLYLRYKDKHLAEYEGVLQIFLQVMPEVMREAQLAGTKVLDPRPFILACKEKYGRVGFEIAFGKVQAMIRSQNLSPHSGHRYVEWGERRDLADLFAGGTAAPEVGRFIDQRYIDYLSNNEGALSDMHWRKFEELTAEYFHRDGYRVELGPGSNDDGVDVRVWRPGSDDNPHIIVQCKRQKAKVEKVVVKGLHSDVDFEGAVFGLIVTSSELSPGARSVVSARGYPIEEVNRDGLRHWLEQLRTPGTGIVRI